MSDLDKVDENLKGLRKRPLQTTNRTLEDDVAIAETIRELELELKNERTTNSFLYIVIILIIIISIVLFYNKTEIINLLLKQY